MNRKQVIATEVHAKESKCATKARSIRQLVETESTSGDRE